MQTLITTIARALVEHPDVVEVQEKEDSESITYELSVHPDDMGKVIGKQGRIAKAIRTVVYAAGSKSNKKIYVDIQ